MAAVSFGGIGEIEPDFRYGTNPGALRMGRGRGQASMAGGGGSVADGTSKKNFKRIDFLQ